MDKKVPQRITTPKWLTLSYILDLLKKVTQYENLTVHETEIEPATAVGDNYVSQMIRLSAVVQKGETATKETIRLILKTSMFGEAAEALKKTNMYRTEAVTLADILPKMDSVLREGFPDLPLLHPRCIEHRSDLDDLIVMEDLRESGFKLADRFTGLDMDHIELALKYLARFHAASFPVIKNQPELLENIGEPAWSMKHASVFGNMFQDIVRYYGNMVSTWQDGAVKEKCLRVLKVLEKDFMKKSLTNFERDDYGFNVLVHGDYKTNNIMYRYENSEPVEIKIVDFQIACYNNPVLDVVYFVFTSPSNDVRFGNPDKLLRIYHEAFTEAAEKLNIVLEKPFTFERLKEEFEKKMWFGVLSAFYIYPYTICPSSQAPAAGEVLDAEQSQEHIYNNEAMAKVLPIGFDYFEKYGLW